MYYIYNNKTTLDLYANFSCLVDRFYIYDKKNQNVLLLK